jgi:hypothetical protein
MNQDFLAGVGNIYADEALWRARLHPLRDAHTLRPDDVRRLHKALRDVLSEAVERRGSSVDDYTAPEGDGSMQEHLAGLPARPASPAIVAAGRSGGSSWRAIDAFLQLVPAASGVSARGGGQASAIGRGRGRWDNAAGGGPATRRGPAGPSSPAGRAGAHRRGGEARRGRPRRRHSQGCGDSRCGAGRRHAPAATPPRKRRAA